MTKDDIINTVCEVCGAAAEELKSKSVARNVTAARHLIAYNLCFRHGTLSLEAAAQEVGIAKKNLYNKCTPIRIRARRLSDPNFREWYAEIERRLSPKTSAS